MLLTLLNHWPAACRFVDPSAFDKITMRGALAAAASFVVALLLGTPVIKWLARRFREPIKCASPAIKQLHAPKAATPTMGGIFVLAGLVGSCLLFGDWTNAYLAVAIGATIALGALGAYDDHIKLTTERRGLAGRTKLIAQSAIAVAAAAAIAHVQASSGVTPAIHFPLIGRFELGLAVVPWAALVIVASSNAVNLADGLDGLAGGCLITAALAIAVLAYAGGHAGWAAYLGIEHVPGAGEMAIVAAAAVGALLGFLWFNCHPAQVFMGNTGALGLGGLLGVLAVIARQEILLVVIAGVFVMEAASVILQVASFRLRKKRVFRCAPLHHHFQLAGIPEGKIVVRFWIGGALCAIVALASLKFGPREAAVGARLPTNYTAFR
jgi:phospho-N-acetylmuramoyl-pentapeptide-transferase